MSVLNLLSEFAPMLLKSLIGASTVTDDIEKAAEIAYSVLSNKFGGSHPEETLDNVKSDPNAAQNLAHCEELFKQQVSPVTQNDGYKTLLPKHVEFDIKADWPTT